MRTIQYLIISVIVFVNLCCKDGTSHNKEAAIITKEIRTARYPLSKFITYTLCNNEESSNICVTAMFLGNKITTIDIGMRNDETFKIPYKRQIDVLKEIMDSLDNEYGLSELGQIFMTTDMWGDASVEIAQKYNSSSSKSFGTTIHDAVYNSLLWKDINRILLFYGLRVDNVWCDDKPTLKTKEQFLKENLTGNNRLPKSFIKTKLTFEVRRLTVNH